MKLLFKIIFILCILTNIVFGTEKNDWERDALKYKVKEFVEKNYAIRYNPGQTNKTLLREVVKKYDGKGKSIDKQEYRYSVLFDEYIDKLNDTGNRVMNTKIADNKQQRKNNRTFNSNKKIESNTDEMSFHSKDQYRYDANGNVIEWANYKPNSMLLSKYKYKYDNKGNLIEDTFYEVNGLLKWKNIYKYDSSNQIIEKIVYRYESLYMKYTFGYDGLGNMTKESQYEPAGESNIIKLIWINEYKYIYW